MNYSQGFWDRIAQRYAKKPVANQAAYQHKLATTRKYLTPEMQVMEIACGTGSTALTLAPLVKSYCAIDVSPNMIAIANQKLAGTVIQNLVFHTSAFEDFRVNKNALDAILAMSILHLVNDRQKVLESIFDILKPGGFFISSTVCIKTTMPYLKFMLPVGKFLRIMPYVAIISHEELKNETTTCGFKIINSWTDEKSPDVLFLVAQKPR